MVLISWKPKVVARLLLPPLEFLPLANIWYHTDVSYSKDPQDLGEHAHVEDVEQQEHL